MRKSRWAFVNGKARRIFEDTKGQFIRNHIEGGGIDKIYLNSDLNE